MKKKISEEDKKEITKRTKKLKKKMEANKKKENKATLKAAKNKAKSIKTKVSVEVPKEVPKKKKPENTTEYLMDITIVDHGYCPGKDPIGLCTVEDCSVCENARVKITRKSDGVVLRDDLKEGYNIGSILCSGRIKRAQIKEDREDMKKDPVKFLEEKGSLTFSISNIEKRFINKLLKSKLFKKEKMEDNKNEF